MASASDHERMPRFIHFKAPGFMSMFEGNAKDGVWINPEQVTSLERIADDGTTIRLSNGRSHTVEGSVDDVIKKLTR